MDPAVKQQIAERIKQANNILVTVSANPSVDQLAACIGLTLLLTKMDKHATAVFSGNVPSTIEFLQPEKTIEANTNSLQDFIISLDKSKADKLRYKVEDQVVRIFITPYRTGLTEKDLTFSQGDFNVEVVIALGVHNRSQIDIALASHGRIFHDATVISINNGPGNPPNLGQINWLDPNSSSLCEMLVSISESFGSGLVDNQMATAFLTGIVAATDRFSNTKTSPKVMTMSAQLMAAGANQQLIVSKLEPPVSSLPLGAAIMEKKPLLIEKKAPVAQELPKEKATEEDADKPKRGTLNIAHKPQEKDDKEVEIAADEIRIDEQGNLKTAEQLKADLAKTHKEQGDQPVPMPPAPDPEVPAPAPPEAPPALPPDAPPTEVPSPIPSPPPPISPPEPAPPVVSPDISLPPLPPFTQDLPPIITKSKQSSTGGEPGSHVLMDPKGQIPSSTFRPPGEPEWYDPYNSTSIDSSDGDESVNDAAEPDVAPSAESASLPEITGLPLLDNARSAVQSAIGSPPLDSTADPVAALNNQPVDVDLHTAETAPAAELATETPSLPLPSSAYRPPSNITGTTLSPVSNIAPPAPPPLPPPLMPTAGIINPSLPPVTARQSLNLPPPQTPADTSL